MEEGKMVGQVKKKVEYCPYREEDVILEFDGQVWLCPHRVDAATELSCPMLGSRLCCERDNGPTLEEMLQYWRAERVLDKCEGCRWESWCWSHEGAVYNPNAMRKTCKHPEVIDAINMMEEMKKGKPLGYYAITAKWWENEEFMRVVGRKK